MSRASNSSRRNLILNFHGVGVPDRRFVGEEEARCWVSPSLLEQVLDIIAFRDDVKITFDDGNLSDYTTAFPLLEEKSVKASFFVSVGLIGSRGMLSRDQVTELSSHGHLVGSHGWSHRDWRRVSTEEGIYEFDRAPRVLAEIISRPVTEVAVPFGSYDGGVLRRLRACELSAVYTSDGSRARQNSWLQSRVSVRSSDSADDIEHLIRHKETVRERAVADLKLIAKRLRQ